MARQQTTGNANIDEIMQKTNEEVQELFQATSELVAQNKLKGTESCLQSTQEAKELFTDFANGKLGTMREAKSSYQASRSTLARLETSLENINKQVKTIYNPAVMESFVQEMDASLQSKLARL